MYMFFVCHNAMAGILGNYQVKMDFLPCHPSVALVKWTQHTLVPFKGCVLILCYSNDCCNCLQMLGHIIQFYVVMQASLKATHPLHWSMMRSSTILSTARSNILTTSIIHLSSLRPTERKFCSSFRFANDELQYKHAPNCIPNRLTHQTHTRRRANTHCPTINRHSTQEEQLEGLLEFSPKSATGKGFCPTGVGGVGI
jgi:hypothetical protein